MKRKVLYFLCSSTKVLEGGTVHAGNKGNTYGRTARADINTANILMAAGMHCVGCPSSQMESLEEACVVHGISCEQLVNALNEYFAQKNA